MPSGGEKWVNDACTMISTLGANSRSFVFFCCSTPGASFRQLRIKSLIGGNGKNANNDDSQPKNRGNDRPTTAKYLYEWVESNSGEIVSRTNKWLSPLQLWQPIRFMIFIEAKGSDRQCARVQYTPHPHRRYSAGQHEKIPLPWQCDSLMSGSVPNTLPKQDLGYRSPVTVLDVSTLLHLQPSNASSRRPFEHVCLLLPVYFKRVESNSLHPPLDTSLL